MKERVDGKPFAAIYLGERFDRDVDDSSSCRDERPVSRRSFADSHTRARGGAREAWSGIVFMHVVWRQRGHMQFLPGHCPQSRDVVGIEHSAFRDADRTPRVAHIVHQHAPGEAAVPGVGARYGAVLHQPTIVS